ncbi:hypothetical protein CLV51_103328 [Chitinophaga niastensis]|uniref:Uncharacterized protein n=1 Tax=Chitinophaga niastensis TaxID=536980 RepID=A0A2P8HJK6_CHINA|nr:hypothetical protein [Chitinophaga niastensis]PSL46350.1 hypothetical protein CLV51_103328 [Chitinophaga niastensis]
MLKFVKYMAALLVILTFYMQAMSQQLIVNAFIPPGGLIQKELLWNIMIANPAAATESGHISLTIINKINGQRMLTASSGYLVVPPGARQLQVSDVMPVVYNALSADINLGGYGFLPVGSYQVCYNFSSEKGFVLGSTCVDATVEVLSPPQLVLPENKSTLKETNPSFSWIPPAPAMLVKNCTYEYKLVKVNELQSPKDAVNSNVPVYTAANLAAPFMNYPSFAGTLEKGQPYAWQITAVSAATRIASDVWTFTLKDPDSKDNKAGDGSVFSRLLKEGQGQGYAAVTSVLKFEFNNDSNDSLFVMKLTDISSGKHTDIAFQQELFPKFKPGKNQVVVDLAGTGLFKRNHFYEFELTDAAGEKWKMKFEFAGK